MFDPGLQLSFTAVASVLRIYPVLRSRFSWERGLRYLNTVWQIVLASLAATVGTAPLCAWHFHQLSVVGLVANVPAGPLASLMLVPLSLVGALLTAFHESLGRPVLWVAAQVAKVFILLAQGASSIPGGVLVLPPPTILEIGLFLGMVLGWTSVSRRLGPRRFGWICAVGLIGSIGGQETQAWLRQDINTTFLPVGQGDAVVVELPQGRTMLIDTGPPGRHLDAAQRVILPFLRHQRIRRLDVVVVTHPHADHIGGLGNLSDHIDIGQVWWTGDVRHASEDYTALMARLPARKVDSNTPPWRIGGAEVRVLGPVQPASSYDDVNDGSVVVKVSLGQRAILFTGDMEAVAERDLLSIFKEDLRASVLKPGHHGSNSSSTEAFLDAVQPQHAVFTLGAHNHFGFPHREVTDRLKARQVTQWRVDRHGAVTVNIDADRVKVMPFILPGSVEYLSLGSE